MTYLTLEQLEKLPTHRLLAYRRKLLKTQWYVEDWVYDCECARCTDERSDLRKLEAVLDLVKSILNTREHVEGKSCKNRRH